VTAPAAIVAVRPIIADGPTITAVQALHERSADYVARVWGLPPDPASGRDFFERLPPGKTPADKYPLGIFAAEGRLVGCIDLVRGWPDAATAAIGLLLLEPAARGRGVGATAVAAIEATARQWSEIETLRAVVLDSNDVARPFWEKQGFSATGQTRPHEAGTVRTVARIFGKRLVR
jgi:RimJ/RimL family protein N-acetyltransferase